VLRHDEADLAIFTAGMRPALAQRYEARQF
jgi:hypothetical protein